MSLLWVKVMVVSALLVKFAIVVEMERILVSILHCFWLKIYPLTI